MGLNSVEVPRILRLHWPGVATGMSVFEQCRKYWCLLLTEMIKWGILFLVDQPASSLSSALKLPYDLFLS